MLRRRQRTASDDLTWKELNTERHEEPTKDTLQKKVDTRFAATPDTIVLPTFGEYVNPSASEPPSSESAVAVQTHQNRRPSHPSEPSSEPLPKPPSERLPKPRSEPRPKPPTVMSPYHSPKSRHEKVFLKLTAKLVKSLLKAYPKGTLSSTQYKCIAKKVTEKVVSRLYIQGGTSTRPKKFKQILNSNKESVSKLISQYVVAYTQRNVRNVGSVWM